MDLLTRIIDLSLRYRALVLIATIGIAVAGTYALWNLDIDAFPDTTPVQVQINTSAPSLGPEEVERQITFPIEQSMGSLPGLKQLRSISKFGLSQVVLLFDDASDIYFVRQVINERLGTVSLPSTIERPKMGPVSTGLGEVLHYIVTGRGSDPTEVRTYHDWVIKPALKNSHGVAEVNSWGGFVKQFQIELDPHRLIKFGLTLDQVVAAVQSNNANVGGGNISQDSGMLLVQGLGITTSIPQIRNIVVDSKDGTPIRLGDLGNVAIGHQLRRGAVTANGQGEVVLGLGFMLMGENTRSVTLGLKERLENARSTLPAHLRIQTVYDRTQLVDYVIDTVRANLFEGGLLVVAILFAFLGNLRAAFLVALAIPLSMLVAALGMARFGIAASLLSLGAIDFGLIVDSSVVLIENCVRKLGSASDLPTDDRRQIIRDAAVEVRKPTLFGELIILIVYLPILTLEGIEGKLFRPMALTVIFAIVGSMLFSMTLMPVLASLCLPKKLHHQEPILMRLAHAIHRPMLRFAMQQKAAVIAIAAAILVIAFGMIAPHLGTEFVPRLSEGSIAIGVVRLAGTDLKESVRYNTQMEKALLEEFPDEIDQVWSRIGTAEIATDPMGVELTDMFLTLKDRALWTKARTQSELTAKIDRVLKPFPGQRLAYSQPIEMRMNEMISGIRSDLGVMLYGDDFDQLADTANEIERVLREIEGASDVAVEPFTGQPVLQIKVAQDQIARYGVAAKQVLDVIETVGGTPLGEIVDGQYRFPLVLRLPESERSSPEILGSLLIATRDGEQIPLSRLASIEIVEGPSTITREWGQRRVAISTNVRGRDLGSFVAEAKRRIAAEVTMPSPRYRVEYGGQFQHMIRAQQRLMIIVPITFLLILMLLYVTYRSWIDALRVFTGIPFAWVGGILALWIRDMPFSISAAIGFIAMSGVAVLDDMILVSTVRQLRERGMGLEDAVQQAAIQRLRPVLMTTLVACFGFLPMALSDGVGAEIQRPLATVVIGGVIGAMFMSLMVLRVLYVAFQRLPYPKPSQPANGSQPVA